jgi:glycolate oxidase iron-sulfur subunit
MLESESKPAKQVVSHIDRCLSCLSCMTTCPSGVDYMHLVDHGRAYIEKHHLRKLTDKLRRQFLAVVLPSPAKFRWLMKIARLAIPVSQFLPAKMGTGLRLAKHSPLDPAQPSLQAVYSREGKSRGCVGLLAGCAQQVVANEINMASIRLLNRIGFDVQILDSDCCGAIEHHLGKTELSVNRLRANLRKWSDQLPLMDAIISNASGCGTMMKDYAHLLKDDSDFSLLAKQLSDKTFDISEFLSQRNMEVAGTGSGSDYTVAYQNPCSMQHGQKLSQQPVQLLRQLGFETTELAEQHLCCGSAGTYNILQADMAIQLGQKKADNIESVLPDIVASGNLGCILQLRQYTGIPVIHTIQLLDWASGGPKPDALVKLN